jgi:uncharacterized membrane protein SpoIIM required for sporulation
MREALFVKNNYKKWKEFENLLNNKQQIQPDRLAALFISLTDDLSYARTHYPRSQNTLYLNTLTARVHQRIYRHKKEDTGQLIRFWKYELPLVCYEARQQLCYAFIIFALAVALGALSASHDHTFSRLIMGDEYINMTLENIAQGDPMGVYKSMGQLEMFVYITLNNIKVALTTFAFGLLLSVGTGYFLFQNGVMLGAFQYFFHEKGLFMDSFLSIWIHGTIEISAIIIAGAAGLVMGNSILFPGTYPRLESFKRGAKKGLKIVIGLVPLFIIAGFLESYITRLTHWHWSAKAAIILASAFFIVYYFVIYPAYLYHKHATGHTHPKKIQVPQRA